MEEKFEAKVVSGGRVTIPAYVRRKLRLEEGVLVWVTVERGPEKAKKEGERMVEVS